MIKFKEWLESDTFQMYHGGQKWSFVPKELVKPTKKRYEGGVGIYFTNNYETARKYAKGNKVVQIANIEKNYKDIKDITIPINELIEFIKTLRFKKKELENNIVNYSNRTKEKNIPADVLNNLIVNLEAGAGENGIKVANFLVSKGVDASLQYQSGNEKWLVVFNPSIIKSIKIVKPKEIPTLYPFELP